MNVEKDRATASSSDGEIFVSGFTDQNQRRWVSISRGVNVGYGLLDDLISSSQSDFYKHLAKQNLIISHSSTKHLVSKRVETTNFDKRLYAVDRLGWHDDVYIWPGRELPSQIAEMPVVDALHSESSNWGKLGSYKEWQKGVHRLVNGQALPTFVLCCAFAAIVQRLFPKIEDNVGFELFGDTSIGKSKLMLLAASVYGGANFVKNWSTTVNALEGNMADHGDSLLLLDETNLFLEGGRDKERDLGYAVFKLAQGTEKARYNSSSVRRDHRFLFLSSTNKAIAKVVKGLDVHTVQAIQARMPTVPANAGVGLGIFDSLPKGCRDSSDAINQVGQLAHDHHGWAALAFVARLEEELGDSMRRHALRRQLLFWVNMFERRTRIPSGDGEAHRIVQKFGLLFAAGRLAQSRRVLPVNNIGRAIVTVYERYRGSVAETTRHQPPGSAIEQVREYVRCRRLGLRDLVEGEYPNLSDQEFTQADGFLRSEQGRRWLFMSPKRWASEFGPRSKALLDELKRQGVLWATEGRGRSGCGNRSPRIE